MAFLLPSHGANPKNFLKALNVPERELYYDFSVNVNPLGIPSSLYEGIEERNQSMFSYPEQHAETLASYIALGEKTDSENILCTNGAAEAFFLICSLFANKKASILQPTFVEYERACLAYGCTIRHLSLEEERDWQWDIEAVLKEIEKVDILFVCHPNNPTGMMYPEKEWELVLAKAKESHTTVVIDEAFADFTGESPSFVSYVQKGYPVIIVRSLTKMYHIPGVRLGYIISNKETVKALQEKQPPWSVNGMAQYIGEKLMNEHEFVAETVQLVKNEREFVFHRLRELGFSFTPSYTNYYLCKIPEELEGIAFLSYLAQEGIVARHTENFRLLEGRYIRLAVRTREENEHLLRVLGKVKKQCSFF